MEFTCTMEVFDG
jgi:hypothetical protein